jgi:hypothetical protein
VLAKAIAAAMGGNGEGKVTRLELFAGGVLELNPEVRELIHAA